MESALIASNIALWIAVVALAALLLALLRQVGVLHERIAPAGALMGGESPRVGDAAPRIEATALDGTPVAIGGADAGGRATLIFFLSPQCPICKALLPALASLRRAERRSLRVVHASAGSADEQRRFAAAHALDPADYLLSEALGLAYSVPRLPYAVLIDAEGIVRARGLVNSREHLESLLEAHERGVASIQEFGRRGRETARTAAEAE